MAVVTVTATGLNLATAPDNFTISVIDYLGTSTQYATGVSRSTLISGYNVTVSPGDVTVRATSTGVCGSSADVDVTSGAMQSYRPNPVDQLTSVGSPESLPTNVGDSQIIMGELTSYPFVNATDFTIEHVSTTGSGGLITTYGPLLDLEVVDHPTVDGTFLINGYTRTSYSTDSSENTSVYKITYTPTGLNRNFNFYWVAGI